ncbi:hypothetical protein HOE39_02220 [Candidatus Woesearchaeota archaeon]|nr:hypothetical protein [Candidatus Woesearchaeota archaeon]
MDDLIARGSKLYDSEELALDPIIGTEDDEETPAGLTFPKDKFRMDGEGNVIILGDLYNTFLQAASGAEMPVQVGPETETEIVEESVFDKIRNNLRKFKKLE